MLTASCSTICRSSCAAAKRRPLIGPNDGEDDAHPHDHGRKGKPTDGHTGQPRPYRLFRPGTHGPARSLGRLPMKSANDSSYGEEEARYPPWGASCSAATMSSSSTASAAAEQAAAGPAEACRGRISILDEPTNHYFDIPTRGSPEQVCWNSAGPIWLVSHDRYFSTRLPAGRWSWKIKVPTEYSRQLQLLPGKGPRSLVEAAEKAVS